MYSGGFTDFESLEENWAYWSRQIFVNRYTVGLRDKVLLSNCYKNCLQTAAENGLESVAFCCISTGVFRFPAELAAEIAVETVTNWLSENASSSVMKVIFNVFGDKDLETYKRVLVR